MLMPRYLGLNDSSSSSGSHGPSGAPGSSSSPPTTVAAHTKIRLLSKVEHNMRQSQGHIQSNTSSHGISHLLHTASTGNGVVDDVDGLLTPMRIKAHMSPPYSAGSSVKSESLSSSSRPERNLWSRAEMLEMLSIMQNLNALEQLNDRNMKSEYVFRQIEQVMRSKGYVKKSSIQIWTKWKFLKSTYNTTTRHGTGVPKVVPEEVYRVLCRMLSDSNHSGSNNNVNGSLSECGNSMDSSKTAGEDNKEDILGVEHPIFGFRLGPIKPEPIDTGYETTQKQDMVSEPDIEAFDYEAGSSQADNGDQEDVPHLPFIVSVKHEPDVDLGMDTTNTPPPTAPASPSPPPVALDETDDESVYSSTPAAPPPLRVASFAKDELRRPTHGILQIDRPPPTLTKMGQQLASPGQMSRSLPLQSTSSINFVHPHSKLMLPRKQNPNGSQSGLRLPRDISVQPTGMRMKTVPMRDTGYSLRPERMIPDIDKSASSPPQSPSTMAALLGRGPPPKYPISGQQAGASTNRHAHMMSSHQLTPLQHQQLQPRKRRLGQSPVMGMPVPVKLQRSANMYESPSKNIRSHPGISEDIKKKTSEEDTKQRQKRHEELFAKELSQLATAMRSAQKEMLQDFFIQQKEIARREHEFQLKQDTMVMRALRKQTETLLRTANELVNNGASEAAKTEQGNRDGVILETQMPFEPETELQTQESEEEIVDGDGEADDDVEETMADLEEEDNDEDDDDENDEVEDDDGDDEEHLGNDSDLEMSTLAMSEGSNHIEVITEEQ